MKKCIVENCGGNFGTRGLCDKHYMRFLRRGDPNITKERFKYNVGAFTQQNELSYYLLGALMTDGSVRKEGTRVAITSKDKDWMEDIRDLISPEKPITHRIDRGVYEFEINNIEICEWLIQQGCTPRKSLTLEFPSIPKKYLPDFIRGCWDGDGCLCLYKNAKGNLIPDSYISSASKNFINDLSKELQLLSIEHSVGTVKLCNSIIDGRTITAKHNLSRLKLAKWGTYQLCKYMYYDGCFCLSRKKNKADDIISLCNRQLLDNS